MTPGATIDGVNSCQVSPSGSRARPVALLAGAMIGWGTIGLFALHADASPLTTAAWRCAFAVLALLVVCGAGGAFRGNTLTRRAMGLTLLGGVALVANWVLLFQAFQSTTLTIATVAYHSEPLFLVLLGSLAARRLPAAADLGWLVVASAGLLLATRFVSPQGVAVDAASWAGVIAALAAGALYAVATFLARETTGIHPQVMTLMQCALGAVLLLPFAPPLAWGGDGWMWIAGMGTVHTGVLYGILYGTVRRLTVVTVAALSFINPAVAVLTDVVVYERLPTAGQLAGIAIIVVATLKMTLRPQPDPAPRREDHAPTGQQAADTRGRTA